MDFNDLDVDYDMIVEFPSFDENSIDIKLERCDYFNYNIGDFYDIIHLARLNIEEKHNHVKENLKKIEKDLINEQKFIIKNFLIEKRGDMIYLNKHQKTIEILDEYDRLKNKVSEMISRVELIKKEKIEAICVISYLALTYLSYIGSFLYNGVSYDDSIFTLIFDILKILLLGSFGYFVFMIITLILIQVVFAIFYRKDFDFDNFNHWIIFAFVQIYIFFLIRAI